jgi:hypothetical protein
VASTGDTISLEELRLLFQPYRAVAIRSDEEMFASEVLDHLRRLLAQAPAEAPNVAPRPPAAVEALGPSVPSPELQAPQSPPADASPPPEPPAASPPTPVPPPAAKVASLRQDLREQVFEKIATPEGKAALLAGKLDEEIQGLVRDVSQEVTPRQILAGRVEGVQKTDSDFFMEAALTGQAFGLQLDLAQGDLFSMAKSAILQSLNEADRKNIQLIKQALILGHSSLNYAKRLSQYYQEITNFLRARKVAPKIIDLIQQSKYIYFEEKQLDLPESALALGIADAFVTLQEAGKRTLEILRILPSRLRSRLKQEDPKTLRAVEELMRESCYNEYRRAIDSRFSGGDHCELFPLDPSDYGILIFDVSGHEEEASRLRDVLVQAVRRLKERSDPAKVLNFLNRFVLQYPFPEDVFVSMVYGVLKVEENRLIYANAGHHPPYLVRKGALSRLTDAAGLALNMDELPYSNGSVPLLHLDCLVLYTDGLTEAVAPQTAGAGRKELFGQSRLEAAITERQVGALRARRAVESILAAVRDQGFQIEDDITIQVYRHI